jgi:hypothetical protein
MKMRGERRGGSAWRLGRKTEARDRGVMGRGKDGPEMIPNGGNKGGAMGKDARGRVEDREKPSAADSV